MRWGNGAAMAACLLSASALLTGCTGGQETTAENYPTDREAKAASQKSSAVNAAAELHKLGDAIPIYDGAQYRDDLTRRDSVMAVNEFGPQSKVYTLATDDSFPQVWHYYVTYLAQFRGYSPAPPYPPENRNWRTMEVNLTQAMQDPFIPEQPLVARDRQIIMQLAETEAEPRTVIRYIVTSGPVPLTSRPTVMQVGESSSSPGESASAPGEGASAPGESTEAPAQ